MKITFLMPAAHEGFNSFNPKKPCWINHGLAILSAYAKKEKVEISLIDFRKISGWQEYVKKLKEEKPDVLGITSMTVDYPFAIKAARICKKIFPEVKILVGGPHATLVPNDFQKIKEIDYIFIGESENSFPKFLSDFKKKKKIPRIIIGKSPKKLNKIIFADRNLFGPYEAPIHKSFPEPFITLISTRGCMFNCSFCQPAERNLHGKKVRSRSVDNFLEEIEFLVKTYKMKSFMIHDDNFIQDKIWLKEFIEKYSKRFNLPFACQGRADIIVRDEENIKKLSKIGLRLIMIGFESGNQRVLNLLRKGTTIKQNILAAQICKKYKILILANYMVGIPTETKKEVRDTIRMIKQIKPDIYSPAILTPTPGTDLYDFCLEKNILLIKNYEDYARNSFSAKIKGQDYKFLRRAINNSLPFKIKFRKFLSKVIPLPIKKILRKFIN